jgi:hypothetical protein
MMNLSPAGWLGAGFGAGSPFFEGLTAGTCGSMAFGAGCTSPFFPWLSYIIELKKQHYSLGPVEKNRPTRGEDVPGKPQ